MQDFMKYYRKEEKLGYLHERGNERVQAYLSLIFERSYNLFVLHGRENRKDLFAQIDNAKNKLTIEDLNYITSISSEMYSKEAKIDWLLNGKDDGESFFNTIDAILLEWHIPKNINYICKCETLPNALMEWLDMAREDFKNIEPLEGEYYLKGVCTTFLFDEDWYCLVPSDIGLNIYTYDHYAEEVGLSLQSYGARHVHYNGMID